MANSHSEEIRPPYRPIHGSRRSWARSLIRSACGWAAWCFHSLGQACGRSRSPATSHSGVPSRSTGSTVQAVKSVPMPTTAAGSAAASRSASRTAVPSAARQSAGSWSAQSGGSGRPVDGSARSIAPCAYSPTPVPSSAPSLARTTTARAESVPKSTPTTRGASCGAAPAVTSSRLP